MVDVNCRNANPISACGANLTLTRLRWARYGIVLKEPTMLEKKQIFNYCGSPKNYVALLVPSQRDDKALQETKQTLHTIAQEFIVIGGQYTPPKKEQSFQRYARFASING